MQFSFSVHNATLLAGDAAAQECAPIYNKPSFSVRAKHFTTEILPLPL